MKSKYLFILILIVILVTNVTLTKISSVMSGQVAIAQEGQSMQQNLQERQFENSSAIALVANRAELAQNLTKEIEQLDRFGRKNAPFAKRSLFVVKPERVNNFVRLVSEMAIFTTGKDNPTFFRFFQNIEQPNQFTLFEEWQNSASFERHLATPHAREFFRQTANLSEDPIHVRLYRNASEPAQGDGTLNRSLVEAQPPAKPTAAKTLERLERHGMAKAQFVLLVDVPVKPGGAAIMKDTAIRVQEATLS